MKRKAHPIVPHPKAVFVTANNLADIDRLPLGKTVDALPHSLAGDLVQS